ncbi:hypothetical protein NQ314_014142, partial [Rhamnusium bicolor]
WAVDDEGCRTPDRAVGNCILAKQCPSITNFLKMAPKPLPSYIKRKLRAYICNFSKGQVKVCCPENRIPIQLSNMKMPDLDDEFLVANHKSLYLLPKDCGYTGIPNKISDGENALLATGPRFKCGGTVINSKYILTAAHCITKLKTPL